MHSGSGERSRHEKWLGELTDLPTISGYEDAVIAWITRWAARRRHVAVARDRHGNVILRSSAPSADDRRRRPVCLTAHLDHPGFLVRRRVGPLELDLEFRGGVRQPYFGGAAIHVIDRIGHSHRAIVDHIDPEASPYPSGVAVLERAAPSVRAGDLGRWALDEGPLPRIEDGVLYGRACDDLAGVAAALAALDVVSRAPNGGHLRVLLTRAEEIGAIGAIAACHTRTLPRSSAVICLETSRSFGDSPLHGGPIVRVGDRTSIFSERLTNRLCVIAERLAESRPGFRWQRKLMTGGTCEATTFTVFGYDASCLCLPLGNYHNMVDLDGVAQGRPARVGPEFIALDDYHGLVTLAIEAARELPDDVVPFRTKLDRVYEAHAAVLQSLPRPRRQRESRRGATRA